MELCWYKTRRRSIPLWSDNMQQTLIEHYFFSLKRQGKTKQNKLYWFCVISLSASKHKAVKPTTTQTLLCALHTAPNQLMTLVLLEPGTHSMGSSRRQAWAFLLRLRHHLSGSWLALTCCLFIWKMSHTPFPYLHPSLFFSLSFSLGKSCSSRVPSWGAAIEIGRDTTDEIFK